MANIDSVQLPDGSNHNIVDNTSGFASQNYVDSAVASVTKTTIGLGNVDNTSDLNKPISTATQAALDTLDEDKADKTDIAPVESSSTASASHATGSQFYFNGQLVTATANINAGGTITLNGNCELSDSVTEQIKFGMSNNRLTSWRSVTELTAYTATQDCYVFVIYQVTTNTGYHYIGIDRNEPIDVYNPATQGTHIFSVPLAKGHTIYIGANASYATYYGIYGAT